MDAVPVRRAVVFDDNEDARANRRNQLRDALEQLALEGLVDISNLEIHSMETRASVQDLISGLPDAEPPVLVVADLFAGAEIESGMIGARLLRALATFPEFETRTRRVAFTRFAFVGVVDELAASGAQAVAAYVPDASPWLKYAVAHVLDDSSTECSTFPPALPVAQLGARMQAVLAKLVPEPLLGDDLVVTAIVKGVANDGATNLQLARISPPKGTTSRRSVQSFLAEVAGVAGGTIPEARDLTRRRGTAVGIKSIHDGLVARQLETAIAYLLGDTREERRIDVPLMAWLTEEEVRFFEGFVELYDLEITRIAQILEAKNQLTPKQRLTGRTKKKTDDRPPKLRENDVSSRLSAILKVKGVPDDEDQLPSPEYARLSHDYGMDETDLSYIMWSLNDCRLEQ